MTITQFGQLPLQERAQYAWLNGKFLLNKEGRWTKTNLYALYDFFVEIWIDRSRNSITHITAFDQGKKLDAYLQTITLPGLF
jgi:hypothetical protein